QESIEWAAGKSGSIGDPLEGVAGGLVRSLITEPADEVGEPVLVTADRADGDPVGGHVSHAMLPAPAVAREKLDRLDTLGVHEPDAGHLDSLATAAHGRGELFDVDRVGRGEPPLIRVDRLPRVPVVVEEDADLLRHR